MYRSVDVQPTSCLLSNGQLRSHISLTSLIPVYVMLLSGWRVLLSGVEASILVIVLSKSYNDNDLFLDSYLN